MQKVILFTMCIAVLLTACKKNKSGVDTPTTNSATMTLGGINYTFNKILVDTTLTGAGGTTFFAVLADDTTRYANVITIAFDDPGPLGAKIYTDTTSTPRAALNFDFDGIAAYNYSNPGNKISPAIIDVTAISAASVQGTFSATLYLNGDIAEDQKSATGRFNLNR